MAPPSSVTPEYSTTQPISSRSASWEIARHLPLGKSTRRKGRGRYSALAIGAVIGIAACTSTMRIPGSAFVSYGDIPAALIAIAAMLRKTRTIFNWEGRLARSLFLAIAVTFLLADLNGLSRYGADIFFLLIAHTTKWVMYAIAGTYGLSLVPRKRPWYLAGFVAAFFINAIIITGAYYLDSGSRQNAMGGLNYAGEENVQGVTVETGKNGYALLLAVILAIVLEVEPRSYRTKQWITRLRLALALGLVLAINVAASRTGLVAAILVLLMYARTAKRRLCVAAVLCATIAFLSVKPELASSLASTKRLSYSMGNGDELYGLDLGNRTVLAYQSLADIWATPIIGRGFFSKFYANDVLIPSGAHNLYIQLIIESGFVGLAIWLALMWSLIRVTWAIRKTWLGYGPLSSVVILSVTAMTEVYLQGPGAICILSVVACLAIAEPTSRPINKARYY